MTAQGFALFDTNIGRCGIAWSARGIAGVQLPEASEAKTRARVTRRYPHVREAQPPTDVRRAIDAITSLLSGEPSDLSAVALDMDGIPEFDRGVYEAARGIAAGATISYGELAMRLGDRNAMRAVGLANGRNPISVVVPCHRVIGADGTLTGYGGGVPRKSWLLNHEGVPIRNGRVDRQTDLFEHDPRKRMNRVASS